MQIVLTEEENKAWTHEAGLEGPGQATRTRHRGAAAERLPS